MHSQQLEKLGLINRVIGVPYNVRTTQSDEEWANQVRGILESEQIEPKILYSAKQCHSSNVAYCDGTNGEAYVLGKWFDVTDGLMTDRRGIALLVKYADCTPIIVFDPIHRVHAVVHSGWRGTVERIAGKAVEQMVQRFGSNPEQLLAFTGPTIDMAHYEVGAEVYDAFHLFNARDTFFQAKGEKYLLNMAEANRVVLLEAGLLAHHIEQSPHSTYTSNILHSARRDGVDYQLNAMITMLT